MTTLAFWTPGPVEIIVILLLGLLLFGKRLPEIGRSMGKSVVEFKKGIRDVQDEIEAESRKVDDPAVLETQPGVQPQGSAPAAQPAAAEPETKPDQPGA